MNNFIAIMSIVLGLIPLIRYSIKEEGKTFFKIMVGASCGVMVSGGMFILMI